MEITLTLNDDTMAKDILVALCLIEKKDKRILKLINKVYKEIDKK